jgi:hypothetical protein
MFQSIRLYWNIRKLRSKNALARKVVAVALAQLGEPKWREIVHGMTGTSPGLLRVETPVHTPGSNEGAGG